MIALTLLLVTLIAVRFVFGVQNLRRDIIHALRAGIPVHHLLIVVGIHVAAACELSCLLVQTRTAKR